MMYVIEKKLDELTQIFVLFTHSQLGLRTILVVHTHMRSWICSEAQANKSAGLISMGSTVAPQEGCRGKRMLMNQQHDSCGVRKHL